MWIAYLVVYEFLYKLILAPIFMLILTVPLMVLLKNSSFARAIGGFLFFAGAVETFVSVFLFFPQGVFLGLLTWVFGLILFSRSGFLKEFTANKNPILKKAAYGVLILFIVLASLAISVRTTTKLLREDSPQNYQGSSTSNLILRGTITDVSLNDEVSIGYAYHVFHACVKLNVTDFVWSSQMYNNVTSEANYWLNQHGVEVYYDRTDVSKLVVGQTVEVKGCYCPWVEDSVYSEKLVVDPAITDSYIQPVNS